MALVVIPKSSMQWPGDRTARWIGAAGVVWLVLQGATAPVWSQAAVPFRVAPETATHAMVVRYCLDCHDTLMEEGDFNLEVLLGDPAGTHATKWERVVQKLQGRQMPPLGKDRPDEKGYGAVLAELTGALDRWAADHPAPGRTDTFRRLNRTEYGNAIRDLLDLEVDVAAWLPKDAEGHGFDNVTVGDLSPTLLERYISAATKISRLAVGSPLRAPGGTTIRLPPDRTQEGHVEGLPIGTRGGTLLSHTFPRDGDYEIRIRLSRDRNEEVEGLHEPHELEVLIDREPVARFTVKPPRGHRDFDTVDAHLKVRLPVQAGPHQVGVTFLKKPSSLLETKRQPYMAHFNMHRHPRLSPAIYQISINGPYDSSGPGETPSRDRIFVCQPSSPEEEAGCAETILSRLIRKAYRRPISKADLSRPLEFFEAGRAEGGFEAGIERALSAVLMSPEFLFRIERDPAELAPGTVYRIRDVELASRLSFFLWSSIPDEPLLAAAEAGRLHEPEELEGQVRRMLADERALNLARNFAGQWLYLRNLETITPNLRLFPDFDDNLRQSFRRETEALFETIVMEDRSVLELLSADYTFLNERLAKHYGIPHVYGSRFRRVSLDPDSRRGGLLRHGSILTVTSYATRTSPVIRGNWVLGNLLGTPPPPPPADVPPLEENTVNAALPMRERLAEHRANTACASCHDLMDPVGFALENFDAIGRWRILDGGHPVDASGGLPDGSTFVGVNGLEEAIGRRPEWFVGALTEKLLTFALGRGIEPGDGPAIRGIVAEARAEGYRFSSLVLGITRSVPFTMRRTQ